MYPKTLWAQAVGRFSVVLKETEANVYAVQYGLHIVSGLTYEKAAKEIGECVLHALSMEARLNPMPVGLPSYESKRFGDLADGTPFYDSRADHKYTKRGRFGIVGRQTWSFADEWLVQVRV